MCACELVSVRALVMSAYSENMIQSKDDRNAAGLYGMGLYLAAGMLECTSSMPSCKILHSSSASDGRSSCCRCAA